MTTTKNMKTMMTALFALTVAGTLFGAQAAEWTFPPNTDPAKVLPADPALAFPDGFKATVRFSVDLAKVNRRSRFANLFCRGNDFCDGYSVMVRYDGAVLVDVVGVEPQYYVEEVGLKSNTEYLLELYVTRNVLRLFIDGKEVGGFAFDGELDYAKRSRPLRIGSLGHYTFAGSLPYLRLEPISAVTLPPGGPKPRPRVAPAHQARAEVKWVRTICAEEGRYIGWPSVCRLQNGDILAVFSGDRDEHICPWGKVQLVRSTDDGETWSKPVTIANTALDDRDAGIVQMPDGEIIVTWFNSTYWTRLVKKGSPYSRHLEKLMPETLASVGDYLIRSRDNGKTWTKPVKLSVYAQTPHGPILLRDGSLLEIGRTFRGGSSSNPDNKDTVIQIARSTDAGRTWKMLCDAVPWAKGEEPSRKLVHEPHAVELADGTLVGMVRYHGSDNCMRLTRSTDGGRTWSTMEKTGMMGLPPHLLALPDGKVVCVYGRRIPRVGCGEFACISDDGGKTWDDANEVSLAPSPSSDLGYPASCLTKNGDILTVYYQKPDAKHRPVLMATRWRVTK